LLVVEVVVKELVLVVAAVDIDKFHVLVFVDQLLMQSLLEVVELEQDLLEVKVVKVLVQYLIQVVQKEYQNLQQLVVEVEVDNLQMDLSMVHQVVQVEERLIMEHLLDQLEQEILPHLAHHREIMEELLLLKEVLVVEEAQELLE
tara:strand:- start:344 stop:778 length:435 start_codon:yes stop_codon:yes gene_type:complete